MTIATSFNAASAEFERVQNARFPASETDIVCDLINLDYIARMIVHSHKIKAEMFAKMATATCVLMRDGRGRVGRYDIASACQAEIDYLEITPEAAMVVEARVAELLAGGE